MRQLVLVKREADAAASCVHKAAPGKGLLPSVLWQVCGGPNGHSQSDRSAEALMGLPGFDFMMVFGMGTFEGEQNKRRYFHYGLPSSLSPLTTTSC